MATTEQKTTISLRLPVELHQATRELARRRGVSLNSLVRESLAALLEAEAEKRFYDSFTLLGQDLEDCDVEYAIHAQAEVVLRDKA